jgi:putative membrane protein
MKHLVRFALRVVVNGAAILLAAAIVPGITVRHQNVGTLMLVGLVIGLVNALLKPIVDFFALPLLILTLGLFQLVVNALLLLLVGWLVPDLVIDGFWPAFVGALIVSVAGIVLEIMMPGPLRKHHAGHGRHHGGHGGHDKPMHALGQA